MRRAFTGFLIGVMLLSGLRCARHAQERDTAEAPPEDAEVAITVENHHWLDMTIYLLHDGTSERLGMVSGTGHASWFVPGRKFKTGSPIRLLADPIGMDRTLTSESLLVRPGQLVRWTLEAQLSQSTASVY
jgi:hypothetical protein